MKAISRWLMVVIFIIGVCGLTIYVSLKVTGSNKSILSEPTTQKQAATPDWLPPLTAKNSENLFLYNGVVTGYHSADSADSEGPMAVFKDAQIHRNTAGGNSFSYGAIFEHRPNGVGMPVLADQYIALLLGGQLEKSGQVNVVVVKDANSDKGILVRGESGVNADGFTGDRLQTITDNKMARVKLKLSQQLDVVNQLIGQYAQDVINSKDTRVELSPGSGEYAYQSVRNSGVYVYQLPVETDKAGTKYAVTRELINKQIITDETGKYKQIIVYSPEERIVLEKTTDAPYPAPGEINSEFQKWAEKIVYFFPNATGITNYWRSATWVNGPSDATLTPLQESSIDSGDIRDGFDPPKVKDFYKHVYDTPDIRQNEQYRGRLLGSLVAPNATVVMKGGNINGYAFVKNLHQRNTMELHNYYNPWLQKHFNSGVTIYKHDSHDKDMPLAGAIFAFMRKKNGQTEYLQDSFIKPQGWTTKIENAQQLVTSKNGLASVSGLVLEKDYQYYFKEIKAPPGYQAIKSEIPVSVNDLQPSGYYLIDIPNEPEKEAVNLHVHKEWQDEDRVLPRPNIQLIVQSLQAGEWIDTDHTQVLVDPDHEYTFANLPKHDDQGREIKYQIQEAPLADYDTTYHVDEHGSTIITNTLKATTLETLEISFNKTFNGQISDRHQAQFKLYKLQGDDKTLVGTNTQDPATGQVVFKNLTLGDYTLEEKPPSGFKAPDPIWFKVYQGSQSLETDFPFVHKAIDNQSKPFELTVLKVDEKDKALKGAGFKLTGPGYHQEYSSGNNSKFVFRNLKPGTYELVETSTPEGYFGLDQPLKMTIATTGKVTTDLDIGQIKVDLESHSGKNLISFKVVNQAANLLPITGGHWRRIVTASSLLAAVLSGSYLLIRHRLRRKGGG